VTQPYPRLTTGRRGRSAGGWQSGLRCGEQDGSYAPCVFRRTVHRDTWDGVAKSVPRPNVVSEPRPAPRAVRLVSRKTTAEVVGHAPVPVNALTSPLQADRNAALRAEYPQEQSAGTSESFALQAVIDGLDNLALDNGQLTWASNSRGGTCDREGEVPVGRKLLSSARRIVFVCGVAGPPACLLPRRRN
jgi:hypothetical protein